VYGGVHNRLLLRRSRIYYGTWGGSLFQSLYDRTPGTLVSLPLMPEWYLLLGVLTALGVYGALRDPVALRVPGIGVPALLLVALAGLAVLLVHAAAAGWHAW